MEDPVILNSSSTCGSSKTKALSWLVAPSISFGFMTGQGCLSTAVPWPAAEAIVLHDSGQDAMRLDMEERPEYER